jgi:hypothetical protein
MAVIDKDAANKASQDKNNGVNPAQPRANASSQEVTSIQDIAERAFNSSYDAVGNVIKSASQAGVERAIADYQREISSFERAFKKDFLQTLEAKAEPYQIGTSALRLLNASGPEPEDELDVLCDRNDYLIALEKSGNITPDESEELSGLQIKLREAGLIE